MFWAFTVAAANTKASRLIFSEFIAKSFYSKYKPFVKTNGGTYLGGRIKVSCKETKEVNESITSLFY